jgi:pilus assembly protein CpaB
LARIRIEVGVSSRRTLILIAAIAVGALAAFAIFNYVGGIEDRANEDVERRPVIKITQPIPAGLTGEEAIELGYLDVEAAIAAEFVPDGYVIDVDTIRGKVAGAGLARNQILVENMFVDARTSQITNARRVETGRVAITISVDNVRGVAGLIVPGDYVNMMAIPSNDACAEAAGAEGAGEAPADPAAPVAEGPGALLCRPAQMVYQAVRVLFVDRSPVPLPGEQTAAGSDGTGQAPVVNTGLLTLSVPPEAAQIIASIGPEQWYLTLVPPDYTPAPIPPLDPNLGLLPGQDAGQLTPCGPDGCDTDDTP